MHVLKGMQTNTGQWSTEFQTFKFHWTCGEIRQLLLKTCRWQKLEKWLKRYSIDFQNCIMQVILAPENTNTFYKNTSNNNTSLKLNLCNSLHAKKHTSPISLSSGYKIELLVKEQVSTQNLIDSGPWGKNVEDRLGSQLAGPTVAGAVRSVQPLLPLWQVMTCSSPLVSKLQVSRSDRVLRAVQALACDENAPPAMVSQRNERGKLTSYTHGQTWSMGSALRGQSQSRQQPTSLLRLFTILCCLSLRAWLYCDMLWQSCREPGVELMRALLFLATLLRRLVDPEPTHSRYKPNHSERSLLEGPRVSKASENRKRAQNRRLWFFFQIYDREVQAK